MRQLFIITIISALFLSCQKNELPIPKREIVLRDTTDTISQPGQLITMEVEMGNDYKTQIWVSLYQGKVIHTNLKTDWDLTFECSASGYHVMLNGSKGMRAYKTNFTSLAEVTDTLGLGSFGKADMPSGNLDSTAIGNWMEDNKVYVINLGYDEKGQIQGFYKFKILSVNATQFTFEYSSIKNPSVMQGTVTKDQAFNFKAYSFLTHQQINNVEPRKDSYDLCFTQYTHLFIDPPQYYQVTGVLNNSYKTRVTSFTDKAFANITLSDTLNRKFSTRRDKIGYDWKEFNLNTNIYTVFPNITYIVNDSKGFYYKIRFIGFVNKSGLKGYPTFEFQRL